MDWNGARRLLLFWFGVSWLRWGKISRRAAPFGAHLDVTRSHFLPTWLTGVLCREYPTFGTCSG